MSSFFNINSSNSISPIKVDQGPSLSNNNSKAQNDNGNNKTNVPIDSYNDVIFTTVTDTEFTGQVTYLAIYNGSKDPKVMELVLNLHEGDEISFKLSQNNSAEEVDNTIVSAKIISSSGQSSYLRTQFGLIKAFIPELPVGIDLNLIIVSEHKNPKVQPEEPKTHAQEDTKTSLPSQVEDLVLSLDKYSKYFNLLQNLLKPHKDQDKYREFAKLLGAKTNPELIRKLIKNTRNVSNTDVDRWIEEELLEPITSAKDDHVVKKTARKFVELKESLQENSDDETWTEISFPIFVNEKTRDIQLYTQKVKRQKGYMSRFVVNLTMGGNELKLDGVIELNQLNHIDKFDLNLFSTKTISDYLQNRLSKIFYEHMTLNAIKGDMFFRKVDRVTKLFNDDNKSDQEKSSSLSQKI